MKRLLSLTLLSINISYAFGQIEPNLATHLTVWSNSDKIALASFFIAFCAFALSIWQGAVQRHHAQISVRPHFVFLRDRTPENPGIFLINSGLGPGSVKVMQLTYEDKTYDLNSESDTVNLLNHLRTKAPDLVVRMGAPGVGYYLNAGWRQPLVEFREPPSGDASNIAREFVSKARLKVEYICLYGISYN